MIYNYNAGVKHDKSLFITAVITLLAVLLVGLLYSVRADAATSEFDEYGYNDKARVFVGDADGVDGQNDGKSLG